MTTTPAIIADFPAFRIIEALPDRRWRHGDEFAIMRSGIPSLFTFGTAAGYAVAKGEDPTKMLEDCRLRGHETHWVNPQAAMLSSNPPPKRTLSALSLGDIVTLQGERFRLCPAPNHNVRLERIEPEAVEAPPVAVTMDEMKAALWETLNALARVRGVVAHADLTAAESDRDPLCTTVDYAREQALDLLRRVEEA